MPCSEDVQKQIGVAEFVMQDNPNMDYSILWMEQCERCKQFEPDHKFKSCGYSVSTKEDGTVLQEFECTRCNFKWEKTYGPFGPKRTYESSLHNRPTFWGETGQSELFESY